MSTPDPDLQALHDALGMRLDGDMDAPPAKPAPVSASDDDGFLSSLDAEAVAAPDWDVDPAVASAINTGKPMPAPSMPVHASAVGSSSGPVACPPTVGQEILHGA